MVSATRPMRTNAWAKRASVDARRTSHSSAMSIPLPIAAPFTAATVGVPRPSMTSTSGRERRSRPRELGENGVEARVTPRVRDVVARAERAAGSRDDNRADVGVSIGVA